MATLKIKSLKPLYDQIITTTERYEEDVTDTSGLLVDATKTAGAVKEHQKVLRVGSSVREVKVGDRVFINPTKYMRKKYDDNSLREDFVDNPTISINIPTVEIDGKDCFLIHENDVAYVLEDYEEVPDTPKSNIITPKTPKIIL